MKITKNRYLAAFAIVVFLLAMVRLIFPSVAENREGESDHRGYEDTEIADTLNIFDYTEARTPILVVEVKNGRNEQRDYRG